MGGEKPSENEVQVEWCKQRFAVIETQYRELAASSNKSHEKTQFDIIKIGDDIHLLQRKLAEIDVVVQSHATQISRNNRELYGNGVKGLKDFVLLLNESEARRSKYFGIFVGALISQFAAAIFSGGIALFALMKHAAPIVKPLVTQ